MTSTDTLTTTQTISALRSEAGSHGDLAMVTICDSALAGDAEALAECARVISTVDSE